MTAQPVHTRPLSVHAQQVAECYAVVYPEAPARTKVMNWLNQARKFTAGGRQLNSADVSEAVNELVAAGILLPSVESRRGVTARGPKARFGTLTQLCESAYQRGTDSLILEALATSLNYNYQYHKGIPENLLEQFARQALISNSFDGFPADALRASDWLWLTEARAEPYLRQLPAEPRSAACAFGLSYLVHNLMPFHTFNETANKVCPNGKHQLIGIRGLILQGKLDEALKEIQSLQQQHPNDKLTQMDCQSMLALICQNTGDDAGAMQHIETALALEKSGSRKRTVYPDIYCFGLSLFSLVRLATIESRSLFSGLLEARRKRKIESDLDWPLYLAAQAELQHTSFTPTLPQHDPDLGTTIYAIGSRWHKDVHHPENHAGVFTLLKALWRKAKSAGYDWVAAEIQSVIEANATSEEQREELIQEYFDNQSAEQRHEALGTRTLTRLVTPLEPWEYSLQTLEKLTHKAKPDTDGNKQPEGEKSRRLIWQLIETHGYAVDARPLEQTLGKNGHWSSGRKVALKRLREQTDTMPYLIPQDIKACNTIQKNDYGWNSKTFYETDNRTIYQLVGHPCVYDQNGEQLDVVEQAPVLTISNTEEHLRLLVEPPFEGPHYHTRIDSESHRVHVTHFTAAHRRIAEAIPTAGLLIPAQARDRLQNILDALACDMSVQSDQQIATGEMQEGSAEPLLAMEPAGQALRVRLRVEPLPDSQAFFDVATGGSIVYVQGPEGSVPVKRDLNREREELERLLLRSEVLAEHYDGRSFFVIDHPSDARELLEDAQANGIRCLWPDDIPFRIKARADISQVSMRIKQASEWFSASGELGVNDENNDPLSLVQLLRLMQAQPDSRFIELGDGEFLSLSRTLKQQLDVLQAFSRADKKDTDDKQLHPMALLALEPLLNEASIESDKAWKKHRKQVQQALNTTAPAPVSLEAELRSYQLEGYQWLERLGRIGTGACLADDMGLGKTVQTLALLLSRAEGGPALVVAPTSVVGNWLQEAQRFAPALNVIAYGDPSQRRSDILSTASAFDLIVVSYGLIVRNIEELKKVHWHTIVLDEAQAIKNAATQRAKCVKQLNADFRVITTGTPVQNNLMDLHSLFGFLNPQLLGSAASFRKRFAVPVSRDNNEHAREQLQQLITPFLLRRHKRDVLKELPERTELTLKVQLSKEEATLYDMIRQEALDSLANTHQEEPAGNSRKQPGKLPTGEPSSAKSDLRSDARSDAQSNAGTGAKTDAQARAQQKMIILSYLTKLRRLCCHPSLVAPGWNGPESKLEEFSATLDELISSGHRALVFSQFVDHLKIIEKHLRTRNISSQYLDGSTTAKQRTERVNAFQAGEGQVFLISLNAGGSGLNLTAADYVIHMDPWWNPAVEDQASDRAHRIGQKRPVTIVRMVTTGTIEEQIQELHTHKRELADSVLAGADSPSLDMDAMLQLLQGQQLS